MGFRRGMLFAAAAAVTFTLAACSSQRDVLPPPDTEQAGQVSVPSEPAQGSGGGLVAGGAQPKFRNPTSTPKSAPNINTVPTEAPKPSSKEERAKTIEGLVADRTNAQYSEQSGRTQPVAVRPLVDTPAGAESAVARLDAQPPARPAEAEAPLELPPSKGVSQNVGPRAPGSAPRRATNADDAEGSAPSGSLGGFRPLSDLSGGGFGKSTLTGTLSLSGGNLTSSDRTVLNTAARALIDSRGKSVLRVVGHGTGGQDRAVFAANELVRVGVAKSSIYVGADNITGPTEVFLDRAK